MGSHRQFETLRNGLDLEKGCFPTFVDDNLDPALFSCSMIRSRVLVLFQRPMALLVTGEVEGKLLSTWCRKLVFCFRQNIIYDQCQAKLSPTSRFNPGSMAPAANRATP